MNIIGFSVCVNYSDLLKLTYIFNKSIFDKYIISTSIDDIETQNFCNENDIICISSNAYKKNNATFNKSAMLNESLKYINKYYRNSWRVSLDVDIALNNLNHLPDMNEDFIYGLKRKIIDDKSYFEEKKLSLETLKASPYWCQDLPEGFPYATVGYFQMFKKNDIYFDENYLTASDCDTDFFYKHFSINETYTLVELEGFHLGEIEKNWQGRITESWNNICV